MLKLKLQYSGHLMRRVDSLEKTLDAGRDWGQEKRGRQRMRWLDGITDSMDVNLSELREMVRDREAWSAAIQENSVKFLKKLEIQPPYDPAIPLLGVHTEETRIERDTCTLMFLQHCL